MSTPLESNIYNVLDVCLPVTLDIGQSTFDIDSGWIAGAFFLGIILGAGIVLICAPFCIRDMEKKRRQDEEEAMITQYESKKPSFMTEETDTSILIATNDHKSLRGSSRKGKKGMKKMIEDDDDDDPTTFKITPNVKLDLSYLNGFSKIMTKFNKEDAEEEMGIQDMQRVKKVNNQLQEEKDNVFLKMLKNRVKKMKVGVTPLSTIMRNVIDDLNNRRKMYEDERNDEEQALKAQHAKDKNPEALENELEKLDSKINQKLAHLHDEERENVRKELAKNTDLSEKEIDDIMDKLLGDMSKLEKKHAMELARQRRALEERLAKRKQIIEMRDLEDQQGKDQITESLDSYDEALKSMVNDKLITEKQKNQILNEYMQDLQKMNQTRDTESRRQQQELADKLSKRRLKRIQQLQEKHQRETAIFLEKADKATETKDFVEEFSLLKDQQRAELENEEVELDQTELQQLDKVRQEAAEDKTREIEQRNEEMNKNILNLSGQDNKYEASKIIDIHKKRMAQLDAERQEEKNRMAAKLRERWEKKMMQLDEERELNTQEQENLIQQQSETVKNVLANSIDLTDEAKQKILKEHEHNMQVLNNQLQRSKLQQQKSLENRLNQRKARLAEQRRKKEEALLSKTKANKEEREKLQQQLEADLLKEQKIMEEERSAAIAAFRQRMAIETDEALKVQEQQLGLLIGRLEVGAARRAAIIQKQDEQLQNLQSKLENRLEREGSKLTGVDQIIHQHNNQVENLNEQLQSTREYQERLIQEKIQAKRLKREHELNQQIEREKQGSRNNSSIRRRGAGNASNILGGVLMEKRHKKQREELEYEMKLELEKSKEELNRQLEAELNNELQEQKKSFLNQLVSNTTMSKEEVEETVDSAVKGNKKAANKLARDIRMGVDRSKTSYNLPDDDSGRGSTRPYSGRPNSASYGGDVNFSKKGKKKRGKSAVGPEPMEGWTQEYDSDELL